MTETATNNTVDPILIVDDSFTVRMYHRQVLEELGFDIDEAKDGAEALEVAHQRPHSLLLVDVNMPKVDGYRFVENIRKAPGLAATPVVMISTESASRDQQRAFQAGANLYLTKPIRADELRMYVSLLVGATTP